MLKNVSDVVPSNEVYSLCDERIELDKLRFYRGRLTLVVAMLPESFTKTLNIMRPPHVEMTDFDEDGYVVIRPDPQPALTSPCRVWSRVFSAAG